jgi:hypothetical protein
VALVNAFGVVEDIVLPRMTREGGFWWIDHEDPLAVTENSILAFSPFKNHAEWDYEARRRKERPHTVNDHGGIDAREALNWVRTLPSAPSQPPTIAAAYFTPLLQLYMYLLSAHVIFGTHLVADVGNLGIDWAAGKFVRPSHLAGQPLHFPLAVPGFDFSFKLELADNPKVSTCAGARCHACMGHHILSCPDCRSTTRSTSWATAGS